MQFNVALMEVPCAMCTRAGVYLITVEPLLRDTSIIRTPLYYGQFTWSLRDRNPYKDYFSKMDTSVIRTLFSVLLMSVIKRFDCIQILRIYQLQAANPGPSITKRPRPTLHPGLPHRWVFSVCIDSCWLKTPQRLSASTLGPTLN